MLLLTGTTQTLELLTSSAANIDYTASYSDHTTSAFTPGSTQGTIASATTTTIVAAPAASTQRQLLSITLRNRHASTSCVCTLKLDIAGTEYLVTPGMILLAGESLQWLPHTGWIHFDTAGNVVIPGTSSVVWGTITGTLADQTDLQAAITAAAAGTSPVTLIIGLS
jgi:hypothetical protein